MRGALLTRAELEDYRAYFGAKRDEPALTRTIDLKFEKLRRESELIERDMGSVITILMH